MEKQDLFQRKLSKVIFTRKKKKSKERVMCVLGSDVGVHVCISVYVFIYSICVYGIHPYFENFSLCYELFFSKSHLKVLFTKPAFCKYFLMYFDHLCNLFCFVSTTCLFNGAPVILKSWVLNKYLVWEEFLTKIDWNLYCKPKADRKSK